jgi:NADPH:quinone reductase-like Zn-dependent oxidoreductase
MKAIVYTEYGPPEVLRLAEVDKPAPKDNEILVRVCATTVSAGVLWARTGKHPDSRLFTLLVRIMFGLTRPRKTVAVQIARYHYGAEVTGVCGTSNLELVESLGAGKVIDYTREDFTRSGETFDVVLDAVGKIPSSRGRSSLKKTGVHLSVKSMTSERIEYLNLLRELVQAGRVRAVIDRCYSLEQTAEAHRYVEKGHKKGNVVITVEQSGTG